MLFVLVGVAVILAVAATLIDQQPSMFFVKRSGFITGKPEDIFPYINNLRYWETWSPWARLDPHSQPVYSGPAEGTGAAMLWSGNSKIGSGNMTIVDCKPGEFIKIRLEFLKPMKALNQAVFKFQDQNGQTLVTWEMSGYNSFLGKLIFFVMNCEKTVGKQFEEGLRNLRQTIENGPARHAA